jgi:hypothetical protein
MQFNVVQRRQHADVYDSSIASNERELAAIWLAGESSTAGSVFQISNPYARILAPNLAPENFREALRLRSLIHPLQYYVTSDQPSVCPCCNGYNVCNDNTAFHLKNCVSAGATYRHNLIQDALAKFLKEYGNANDVVVTTPNISTIYYDLYQETVEGPIKRADLSFQRYNDPHIQYIDITISSVTRVARGYSSHISNKQMLQEIELDKLQQYDRFPRLLESNCVVPFAFDSFGNMSPSSVVCLNEFATAYNVGNGVINSLKRKFTTLVWKGTTSMIINSRKRFLNSPRLHLRD